MMRTLITLSIAAIASIAQAQECGTGRYTNYNMFPALDSAMAVPFGSNTPVSGTGTQTLYMDVYMPAGDALQARPVWLCAFGGSFVGGARGDVAGFCRIMAHLGYVAIAPDYRVGAFFPNQLTTTRAVVRSMHDLKACVRYLRKSVAVLSNPYHIDPARIITGGVSAGAIGAIHATYLDQSSEIPPVIYGDTAAIGGLEGNSGSPGYSSDVLACYSFSGAIGDTSWIQAGDQPLCSLHENADPIVPYGTQEVYVSGFPTGLIASGSADIQKRMDHVGVPDCFKSYFAAQHLGYLSYDPINSVDYMVQFCARAVCNDAQNCGIVYSVAEETAMSAAIGVFPNPGTELVRLEGLRSARSEVLLIDATGRVLIDRSITPNDQLDVSGVPDGVYQVLVRDQERMKHCSLAIAR